MRRFERFNERFEIKKKADKKAPVKIDEESYRKFEMLMGDVDLPVETESILSSDEAEEKFNQLFESD